MRKSFTLFALAAFLFAACGDDDLVQDYSPAQVGDEINFGGNAAFEYASNAPKRNSRTVYGDKDETGTEVLWFEGDKVRIACPQSRPTAAGDHFVDYAVQNFIPATGEGLHDGQVAPHNTALARCADESYGLQWGGTGAHDFYAVYPSVDQFAAATEGGNASLMAADSKEVTSYNLNCTAQGATFTGYLPSSQDAPLGSKLTFKDGVYTVHPAMRYAYMVAKNVNITPNGSPIPLKFHPIVTAVEVTLINNTDPVEGDPSTTTSLNDISMVGLSAAAPICGQFTYNFEDGSCKLDEVGAKKLVSVSVKNEQNLPVSLKKGESLKVTFFLMPNANLKNLSVSIMAGSVIKTANLSGNYGGKDFEIQVKKKNFINKLPVTLGASDASNWLSALPDETPLYNLSIPGAANAFSAEIQGTHPNMADQTLNLDELWAKGVRCFELWADAKNGSFENEVLVCGTQKFTTTVGKAMKALQQKVAANPDEFAIVIIGYQPAEGGSAARNAANWSDKFNQYWVNSANFTTLDGKTAISKIDPTKTITLGRQTQYKPILKLGDARGKLFVMTRCTSAGADGWWNSIKMAEGGNISAYTSRVLPQIVAISGWGSLTDAWYKRGYEYIGWGRTELDGKNIGRPFYAGTELAKYKATIIENLKHPTNPNTYLKGLEAFNRPGFFAYDVFSDYNKVIGNQLFVYAQDWRRVAETNFEHLDANGFTYFWPESYTKKLQDVKNAFTAAKYTGQGFVKESTILINCLAGFFITKDEPLSYKPIKYYRNDKNYSNGNESGGQNEYIRHDANAYDPYGGYAGDIASFAKRMNHDAYQHIIEVGVKNINYPLGIVMMSRIDNVQPVPNDPAANIGGYYLPQIIVANNFKR